MIQSDDSDFYKFLMNTFPSVSRCCDNREAGIGSNLSFEAAVLSTHLNAITLFYAPLMVMRRRLFQDSFRAGLLLPVKSKLMEVLKACFMGRPL